MTSTSNNWAASSGPRATTDNDRSSAHVGASMWASWSVTTTTGLSIGPRIDHGRTVADWLMLRPFVCRQVYRDGAAHQPAHPHGPTVRHPGSARTDAARSEPRRRSPKNPAQQLTFFPSIKCGRRDPTPASFRSLGLEVELRWCSRRSVLRTSGVRGRAGASAMRLAWVHEPSQCLYEVAGMTSLRGSDLRAPQDCVQKRLLNFFFVLP